MTQQTKSVWLPREDCLTRTCSPMSLGVQASFEEYVRNLVAAEDLVAWAKKPAAVELPAYHKEPRQHWSQTALTVFKSQLWQAVA